jgi:uncharacterized membrane protein
MPSVNVESPVPSGSDLVGTAKQLFMAALGFDSPQAQMVSSGVLFVALVATSAIGLVGTIVLLPIPVFLFGIGVLRFGYQWLM